MLNAVETVTVVNHLTEDGKDVYRCTVIRGASWYWQNKVTVDNGLKHARILKCRIPRENTPPGLSINPGDKIVREALESVTGADFAKLTRMYEGATVLDAHKNTYGPNPHWYVEGG